MAIIVDPFPPRRVWRQYRQLSTASVDSVGVQGFYDGQTSEIWLRDGMDAYRPGFDRTNNRTNFALQNDENLVQALLRHYEERGIVTGNLQLEPMNLYPGSFFPRMARPNIQHPTDRPCPFGCDDAWSYERVTALNQFAILSSQLQKAFQTVHPHADNFNVYGNTFRNILILAATEVESQW